MVEEVKVAVVGGGGGEERRAEDRKGRGYLSPGADAEDEDVAPPSLSLSLSRPVCCLPVCLSVCSD